MVHLAGGKSVVVDAKVPLDAFLDATGTDDDEERRGTTCAGTPAAAHPRRPARRQALLALAAGDARVRGAVRAGRVVPRRGARDRGRLLEYAAERQVVLATPTTLIALLRTVAHGWSHEALADQAREIHRLGRELHERLATMSGHLDQVGRSLNAAVGHYNQAVGSLESRVLVTARAVRRPGRHRRRAAGAAPGRDHQPALGARVSGRTELRAADPPRRRPRIAVPRPRPAPTTVVRCGAPAPGAPEPSPYVSCVTRAHTLWEEGTEPGRQVVALGVAVALTVGAPRPAANVGRLTGVLRPRASSCSAWAWRCWSGRRDFFTVGVLPPLLMVGVFVLLGAVAARRRSRDRGDGLVQAVVTGLAHHAGALVVGYALCLACSPAPARRSKVEHRVVQAQPRTGPGRRPRGARPRASPSDQSIDRRRLGPASPPPR